MHNIKRLLPERRTYSALSFGRFYTTVAQTYGLLTVASHADAAMRLRPLRGRQLARPVLFGVDNKDGINMAIPPKFFKSVGLVFVLGELLPRCTRDCFLRLVKWFSIYCYCKCIIYIFT